MRLAQLPIWAVAAQARELVQALLELHGTTLERALEIVHENDLTLVDKLADDPLFLICHPARPASARFGGARAGRARKSQTAPRAARRQRGSDRSNAGGWNQIATGRKLQWWSVLGVTLKSSIEEAIYAAAPDVTGMEVEGAVDNFVNAPDGLQPKFTVCPTDNEQETTTKRDP